MYLKRDDLLKIGFKKVGKDVSISDKCSIYGAGNMKIGSNVRIDDFCVLSGEIEIGSNVHIACFSALIGRGLIQIDDFAGVSLRCVILSSNADYSGRYLTNPNIPEKYLNTHLAPVHLGKHSLLGAGSVILPGVSLGVGAVIGANSLVKGSVGSFEVWCGNPARYKRMRQTDLLKLEKQLRHV